MLNKHQSELLERHQRKFLKTIYSWDVSYEQALKRSGLDRLDIRRSNLIERFAKKLSVNERFSDWFPLLPETGYPTRASQKYQEFPFRTEWLRGAPIYTYRRALNFLYNEEMGII